MPPKLGVRGYDFDRQFQYDRHYVDRQFQYDRHYVRKTDSKAANRDISSVVQSGTVDCHLYVLTTYMSIILIHYEAPFAIYMSITVWAAKPPKFPLICSVFGGFELVAGA